MMKRLSIQLFAIISGVILVTTSAGAHLGIIAPSLSAVITILIVPVLLISVGLLFAARLTDGDIPFMGY